MYTSINSNCTNPVFVYGSLLDGLSNHEILKRNSYEDADFGGVFATVDTYLMLSLGMFPGVICQVGLTSELWSKYGSRCAAVLGEVWWVTDEMLETLDSLEGHPDFYKRVPTAIRAWERHSPLSSETEFEMSLGADPLLKRNEVWMYVLPSSYARRNYEVIDPLHGYSVRGILSWSKVVTGESPPMAATI